jgi:hypothetical protein
MQYKNIGAILLVSILLFSVDKFNGHPIDVHIPTSHDYLFEYEYERMRANQEAEAVLKDPEASSEDLDNALDQLFGPNGNRA